jgi:hypothetical protein
MTSGTQLSQPVSVSRSPEQFTVTRKFTYRQGQKFVITILFRKLKSSGVRRFLDLKKKCTTERAPYSRLFESLSRT